jgi:hypothetical protein
VYQHALSWSVPACSLLECTSMLSPGVYQHALS